MNGRENFLGASDFGPLLGLSRFKSAEQLFEEKMGRGVSEPESLYQSVGKALEPLVLATWAARVGAKLLRGPEYRHPEFPWVKAALDGEAELPTGEVVVVESKTCSFSKRDGGWGAAGSELIPACYWAQVQAQLLCARANGRKVERAVVPVLFLNRLGDGPDKQPQEFEVTFDARVAASMLSKAIDFWARVEAARAEQQGAMQ